MSKLDFVLEELVTSNRVLANEGIRRLRPCQRAAGTAEPSRSVALSARAGKICQSLLPWAARRTRPIGTTRATRPIWSRSAIRRQRNLPLTPLATALLGMGRNFARLRSFPSPALRISASCVDALTGASANRLSSPH